MSSRINIIMILIASSVHIKSQDSCFVNSSLEGTPAPHVVPAPWSACFGSPDTQPGQWGITQPASDGNTYVSLLADGTIMNGYSEGFSQVINYTFTPNTSYAISFDLAHSNVYNTASPGNCPSTLQIWGGNGPCMRTQLLWQSGIFLDTNWNQYTASFIPTAPWTHLTFEPYVSTYCGGYVNCMIDNISCIVPSFGTVTYTNSNCNTSCTGSASATFFSGTPPFTYLWSPGNLTTQTITGLCPGTYNCLATDSNGQTFTGAAPIVNISNLSCSINSQSLICYGSCTGWAAANLSGGIPPYNITWMPGNYTSGYYPNLCPGTYTVNVTDGAGCTAVDSVTITSLPQLFVSHQSNASQCSNTCSGSGTVTVIGGTPPYAYYWNPGPNSTPTNNNLCPNTLYGIQVTDAAGCLISDTITVSSPGPTTFSLSSSPTCVDPSGSAWISSLSGVSPYSFLWNPPVSTDSVATGLSFGTYTVQVTDGNGCIFTNTITVTLDSVIMSISPSITIQLGDSVQLQSGGGSSYFWTPSTGLSCTLCQNPFATPTSSTTYCVIITSSNGCTNAGCTTVLVETPPEQVSCPSNPSLAAPNAFSPNGDQRNDLFLFEGFLNCVEEFSINIFDRWGTILFYSQDVQLAWDGTFLNSPVENGVYLYIIKFKNKGSDKTIVKKGNVTLMR